MATFILISTVDIQSAYMEIYVGHYAMSVEVCFGSGPLKPAGYHTCHIVNRMHVC